MRCFPHTPRLSISPIPFTLQQTPPFHKQHSQRTCAARRIRLRRMRLAAAYAAAPCRPAPVRAGRRAARFSRVMLSYPLKPFPSLGICTIYPCGVLPNADILQTLRKPQCMLSPTHGGFQSPRFLSHPDKRRLSHKQRSRRTCAARRIRLRRMRLAAAYAAAPCLSAPAGRIGAPRALEKCYRFVIKL